MAALCVFNSEFAEISDMCKRGGDIGIRFYYEFENLRIISLMNEGSEALIKGEIKLIHPSNRHIFAGRFLSGCRKIRAVENKHTWKLGEINIEWED